MSMELREGSTFSLLGPLGGSPEAAAGLAIRSVVISWWPYSTRRHFIALYRFSGRASAYDNIAASMFLLFATLCSKQATVRDFRCQGSGC